MRVALYFLCGCFVCSVVFCCAHRGDAGTALEWWVFDVIALKGPGVGGGGFYGLSGFSKASKILLRDIVCSSFRWLFLVNSA